MVPALLLTMVLFLGACGDQKFTSARGAKKYLASHRVELEQVADGWLSRKDREIFCRFSNDEYRWNDKQFKLDSQFHRDLISSADFQHWKATMQALDGYCISAVPYRHSGKTDDAYVVITLQGEPFGSWESYGYAYAPPRSAAWEGIKFAADSRGHEFSGKTWVYDLGEGWFYYVDLAR
jgi:hypothetical protein